MYSSSPASFGVDAVFTCSVFPCTQYVPSPLVSVVPWRRSLTCDRSSVWSMWSEGAFVPKHVREGNTLHKERSVVPLLCLVLQQCSGRWCSTALSPCRGFCVSGHARSVMVFGLNLYSSSCWHWPARSIYCGYRCAALVCVQGTKTGGGREILCFALKAPPRLHFLSNRALEEMRWAYVYVS